MVEQVRQVLTDRGIGSQQTEILVDLRGLGVVVARPDVAVATEPVLLASHDENDLRVGLQPHEAIDDVHARPFELTCPDDVRLLVETGLNLHQRRDLLALLGSPDERRHDGCVIGGAVEGLLDREHVRVVGGLGDERLDRGRERVVGVVNEHTALSQHREQVNGPVPGGRQARLGHRDPGRLMEIGSVDGMECPKLAQTKGGRALVNVVRPELELGQAGGREPPSACPGRPRA